MVDRQRIERFFPVSRIFFQGRWNHRGGLGTVGVNQGTFPLDVDRRCCVLSDRPEEHLNSIELSPPAEAGGIKAP